jgi:hypothetical protein
MKQKILGVVFILLSLILFLSFTVWIIIAKLYPTDNFLTLDKTYCIAIPLLFPMTFLTAYMKWTAFNYFKHC